MLLFRQIFSVHNGNTDCMQENFPDAKVVRISSITLPSMVWLALSHCQRMVKKIVFSLHSFGRVCECNIATKKCELGNDLDMEWFLIVYSDSTTTEC